MKIRFCPFPLLTVRGLDGLGRSFGCGAAADLDEVIGVDAHGAPLTLEAALGDRAAQFSTDPLVAAPVQPSPMLDVVDDDGDISEAD